MNHFVFQYNRLIGKVGLMLLTFLIGLTSTFFEGQTSPPKPATADLPPKVTFCQLVQNPEVYNGRIVRIEAELDDFDGMLYIFDRNCDPSKEIGVGPRQGYEFIEDQLNNILDRGGPNNLQVRVLLTGKFKANAHFTCVGWTLALGITNAEILSAMKAIE